MDKWLILNQQKQRESMESQHKPSDGGSQVESYTLHEPMEIPIQCSGRNLRIDAYVQLSNGKTFYYESDGPQHFQFDKQFMRETKSIEETLEIFQGVYYRDRIKENTLKEQGHILYRVSYRQFYDKDIMKNILKSIIECDANVQNINYMDIELYNGILSNEFRQKYGLFNPAT